ncbi:Hypothetical predicted protein [Paramuricea clavata]|uniref:Uncharacterized protein n=1 Tax=Paramuricea clavata TaxID=317549 RepID=A0A6S7FVI2_PARCT|nr:Hypothetical predicted protein [Paramuricea clavata]
MATAGGLFGHVGEFNSERETFKSYVERMEMFFTANNIVETPGEENEGANQLVKDWKRAIFLTEIGADVYSTLTPLEIAESFHFGTRSQKPGESIGEYVVALKKLSIHCNFGEFLNRALRNRFVCGLNNVKIQNKLLTTENITFDKACQIAKSMEMAERNTQEFHPTTSASASSEGTVNQIESKRNDEQVCYSCKIEDLHRRDTTGMKGFEAHITMKDGARPVFVKPRKVPSALKEAVEAELEKLERNGVIKTN